MASRPLVIFKDLPPQLSTLDSVTSVGLSCLPSGVSQIFIPEGFKPLNSLPLFGSACYNYFLIAITRNGDKTYPSEEFRQLLSAPIL